MTTRSNSRYPFAPNPLGRTLLKALAGWILIVLGYTLTQIEGWKSAYILGPIVVLAYLATRSSDAGIRTLGAGFFDSLMCGLGVMLVAAGFWLWELFDKTILLCVPLATAWLWWELARDEGFGPCPREPIAFDGDEPEPQVFRPEVCNDNSGSDDSILDSDFSRHEHGWVDFGGSRLRDASLVKSSFDDGATPGSSHLHPSAIDWETSTNHIEVNPATGLTMIGGIGGVDTAGNSWGSSGDSWDHSSFSSSSHRSLFD